MPDMKPLDEMPRPKDSGWRMTNPHPTRPAHTHSADDGRVGWRHHYVPRDVDSKGKALCGLRPRHGWGSDLFADELCERCRVIAVRLNIPIEDGLKRAGIFEHREWKAKQRGGQHD